MSPIFFFLIPTLQLPFELGIIDVSALSVVTGVVSVLTVLPAAAMICFLFRLRDVTLTGSGAKRTKDTETENNVFEGVVCSFSKIRIRIRFVGQSMLTYIEFVLVPWCKTYNRI